MTLASPFMAMLRCGEWRHFSAFTKGVTERESSASAVGYQWLWRRAANAGGWGSGRVLQAVLQDRQGQRLHRARLHQQLAGHVDTAPPIGAGTGAHGQFGHAFAAGLSGEIGRAHVELQSLM